MSGSCIGCKFLWADGSGYSDYTWEDTDVRCAKERNPSLPVAQPYDWNHDEAADNLPATKDARCSDYSPGPYITVSPDGYWDDEPVDDEQKAAIGAHREYRKE
jgi:hypothetical protein